MASDLSHHIFIQGIPVTTALVKREKRRRKFLSCSLSIQKGWLYMATTETINTLPSWGASPYSWVCLTFCCISSSRSLHPCSWVCLTWAPLSQCPPCPTTVSTVYSGDSPALLHRLSNPETLAYIKCMNPGLLWVTVPTNAENTAPVTVSLSPHHWQFFLPQLNLSGNVFTGTTGGVSTCDIECSQAGDEINPHYVN